MSVLKGISGAAKSAGDVAAAGGTIGGLIPRPDRDKQQAAGTQQNVEKAAADIERAVNEGRMDVDSGIMALRYLNQMGGISGGGPAQTDAGYGGQGANLMIQEAIGRLNTKRNEQLTQAYRTPQAPDMANGQPAPFTNNTLGGAEGMQNARMRTGARNILMGTELGGQLQGSPLANALKPTDTFGNTQKAMGQLPDLLSKLPKPNRDIVSI